MTDAAVPEPNGERAAALPRRARRAAPALTASLACAFCLACDGGARGEGPGMEDTRTAAGAYAGLAPVLTAALEERRAGADGNGLPDAPAWPRDLRFHPEAPVESIELLALLEDGDGRLYSFNRRFDRLSLGANGRGAGPDGTAGFAFDDIVSLAGETLVGAVGAESARNASGPAAAQRRTLIERVALGLASAEERLVAVRDVRLEHLTPAAVTAAEPHCGYAWRLVEGETLDLSFGASACPSAALLGGLALATSAPLEVGGTLRAGEARRTLSGRGWARRAWGEVPSPGGAVVFDRLLLELEGVGAIEVTRSKRRSGRGPRTATARLREGAGEEEIAVEWTDAAGSTDGSADERLDGPDGAGAVPASWRFEAESLGVDVTLVPPAGGRTRQDATGPAWRGAVRAEGSHRGVGFVEFVPIGAAASVEERS